MDRATPASDTNRSTVNTVERAVDVLMHFVSTSSRDLGVTEIADALGLSKAVVHRVLTTLRGKGLIELDETTRRYKLGVASMRLGIAYMDRIDVRRSAHPELVWLSQETHETATLSVRTNHTRMYIDQVLPDREVIMSVTMGEPYPLHAGASSKAFLANLSEHEINEYINAEPLTGLTSDTITDVAALRTELSMIREQGWARSHGERKEGAASVAAAIINHRGIPVAVMSVCGPVDRFNDEFERCRDALLRSTTRLSKSLGGIQPD